MILVEIYVYEDIDERDEKFLNRIISDDSAIKLI